MHQSLHPTSIMPLFLWRLVQPYAATCDLAKLIQVHPFFDKALTHDLIINRLSRFKCLLYLPRVIHDDAKLYKAFLFEASSCNMFNDLVIDPPMQFLSVLVPSMTDSTVKVTKISCSCDTLVLTGAKTNTATQLIFDDCKITQLYIKDAIMSSCSFGTAIISSLVMSNCEFKSDSTLILTTDVNKAMITDTTFVNSNVRIWNRGEFYLSSSFHMEVVFDKCTFACPYLNQSELISSYRYDDCRTRANITKSSALVVTNCNINTLMTFIEYCPFNTVALIGNVIECCEVLANLTYSNVICSNNTMTNCTAHVGTVVNDMSKVRLIMNAIGQSKLIQDMDQVGNTYVKTDSDVE